MHIELFENGEFSITTKSFGIVKGRFSMNALDFFCEEHKIDSYLEMLIKIRGGMKIGQYGDYILAAVKDKARREKSDCKLKKEDILDIIDECGGLQSNEFVNLMKHGYGRIVKLKGSDTDDSKKKMTKGQRKR